MTKIIMNKEMPLSMEWIPQNAYMHNSLDHLLPGDRNQDFLIIKQEAEFFQSTLNSQSVQNKVVHLQVLPKEKDKEIKQQSNYLDTLATVSFNCLQLSLLKQINYKNTAIVLGLPIKFKNKYCLIV